MYEDKCDFYSLGRDAGEEIYSALRLLVYAKGGLTYVFSITEESQNNEIKSEKPDSLTYQAQRSFRMVAGQMDVVMYDTAATHVRGSKSGDFLFSKEDLIAEITSTDINEIKPTGGSILELDTKNANHYRNTPILEVIHEYVLETAVTPPVPKVYYSPKE